MKDLQIEWLVQDLIPKGAIAILGGPPGKGKSWMLLDLALACISGRMWLGKFKTMSGRVLYIDEESPPALLRHRLNRLLTGWGGSIPDADLSVVLGQGLCLANDRSVDRLRYTVAAIHPTLVIVDSLIRVHGSEENSASEMAQVFAGVKSLVRDYGCSVVFADHQKKPGIGPVSQDLLLRGTTEKVAFVDTLLSLYSRDGALIVEHSKSRFAQPVPSFVIAIEDPEPDRTVVRVVGEAENLRQKEREERATEFVTRFLEDGEWKSRKGMAKAARASGVCVKAMDEVLKDFQDQGIVERDDRKPEHGRGGKSAYYRLVVTDDPVSDFPSIIKEENGNGVIEPGEPLLKTS